MSKERLFKAWREAPNKEQRDYISFLFWNYFGEPIYKYVY